MFIGLFTPIGPNNILLYILSPRGWLSAAVVLLTLFGTERQLKKLPLSVSTKILANLVVLFILTNVIDLIMFQAFISIELFLQSLGMPFSGAY